jgi:hypothetical protein
VIPCTGAGKNSCACGKTNRSICAADTYCED